MASESTSKPSKSLNTKAKEGGQGGITSPTGRFHINSDVDVSPEALHHTLGYNPGQAAPGTEFKGLLIYVAALELRIAALEGP